MLFSHKCRRTSCRKRTVLRRKVEEYIRRPRCPGCGQDTLSFDKYNHERRVKRKSCHCDGYPYPHRIGWGVYCQKHPTGPAHEDHYERYGY
jgi:hypothetical protein